MLCPNVSKNRLLILKMCLTIVGPSGHLPAEKEKTKYSCVKMHYSPLTLHFTAFDGKKGIKKTKKVFWQEPPERTEKHHAKSSIILLQ